MTVEETVVALVPMRHRSARVQGKNFRPLGGRPLYEHILSALGECPEVGRIVVDTDSPTIWEGIVRSFPEVKLIERPENLRGEGVPMNDVLRHDVSQVPADFYLQTHSTNPLVKPETIRSAIQAFFEAYPQNDSLFTVTKLQTRLWSADGKPINHDPQLLARTQDLEPLFEENSCIYLFEREGFMKRGNRLGENPLMFEMTPDEALDIDDEWDFTMAELLIGREI